MAKSRIQSNNMARQSKDQLKGLIGKFLIEELEALGHDEIEFIYDAMCAAKASYAGVLSEREHIHDFYNVPVHQRNTLRAEAIRRSKKKANKRAEALEARAELERQEYVYTNHSKVRIS